MLNKLVIPLSLLLIQNVKAVVNPGPLVETNVGWIQGLQATDGDHAMFLGIPYARVNETFPFGESLPEPNFQGIFSAFDDSSICAHREPNGNLQGSLDCLHLNIHVPNSASPQSRLPVMVWIHGGGFTLGYSGRRQYNPKFLVQHDVIFVSLNYRLGPYGFMCLDIPEVTGNQGLKDQLRALKWIRDNIGAFGGDVDKITLFGESAGAMSTDLHLFSDEDKLYRNVILISGTSLRGKILVRDGYYAAPMRIAEQLGYNTDDVYEALSYLSTVDAITLVEASHRTGLEYRPCVEKYFPNANNFLLDYPINLNVSKVKDMPVLLGHADQEQLYVFANNDPGFYESVNSFHNQISTLFDFSDKQLVEMSDIVKQFYIGDEPRSFFQRHGIIDFDSDVQFNYPAERTIQKYLENDVGNLYHYVFSYNGGRNWMKHINNIQFGGASHSDILGYLFGMDTFPEMPTPEDQLVINRLTTMWTNFAKYNDPTPTPTPLLPVKWEPITIDSPHYYMSLDWRLSLPNWPQSSVLQTKPFNKRMAFWDLFYDGNREFERGYPQ